MLLQGGIVCLFFIHYHENAFLFLTSLLFKGFFGNVFRNYILYKIDQSQLISG